LFFVKAFTEVKGILLVLEGYLFFVKILNQTEILVMHPEVDKQIQALR
jgi:hypothetical protein